MKSSGCGYNGARENLPIKNYHERNPPDSGDVIVAKGKTIGYLSQHQSVTSHHTIYDELLEVKKDVLELFHRMNELELSMKHTEGPELDQMLNTYARLTHEFESANGYAYKSEITGVLKGLGFTEDEFSKEIHTLSGGQKPEFL